MLTKLVSMLTKRVLTSELRTLREHPFREQTKDAICEHSFREQLFREYSSDEQTENLFCEQYNTEISS